MPSVRFEQRSVLNAVENYLNSRGWLGITYTDGYYTDQIIEGPFISVVFPPTKIIELELGRGKATLFDRLVTINAYMENEGRALDIVDTLLVFLDEECVIIEDNQSTALGSMIVSDTDSIRGEVIAPIMNVPRALQWRGIAQAHYEAHYL